MTKSCHITGSWTLAAEQKAGARCNDYTGTLQRDGNIIKQPVNNRGAWARERRRGKRRDHLTPLDPVTAALAAAAAVQCTPLFFSFLFLPSPSLPLSRFTGDVALLQHK